VLVRLRLAWEARERTQNLVRETGTRADWPSSMARTVSGRSSGWGIASDEYGSPRRQNFRPCAKAQTGWQMPGIEPRKHQR
jgi:hypothetical protein